MPTITGLFYNTVYTGMKTLHLQVQFYLPCGYTLITLLGANYHISTYVCISAIASNKCVYYLSRVICRHETVAACTYFKHNCMADSYAGHIRSQSIWMDTLLLKVVLTKV